MTDTIIIITHLIMPGVRRITSYYVSTGFSRRDTRANYIALVDERFQ